MAKITAFFQEERMDEYEQAYGKRTTIYITKDDRDQLNDGLPFGRKWWEPIPYATEPDKVRCIETQVGEVALEDGIFYPDRYEPDLAAECCEEVKVKARKAPKAPKRRQFRKGDRIRQTYHGPGTIVTDGREAGTVIGVSKGHVRVHWDDSEDRQAPNIYDSDTGWEVDGVIPGFTTRIHLLGK